MRRHLFIFLSTLFSVQLLSGQSPKKDTSFHALEAGVFLAFGPAWRPGNIALGYGLSWLRKSDHWYFDVEMSLVPTTTTFVKEKPHTPHQTLLGHLNMLAGHQFLVRSQRVQMALLVGLGIQLNQLKPLVPLISFTPQPAVESNLALVFPIRLRCTLGERRFGIGIQLYANVSSISHYGGGLMIPLWRWSQN